MSKFDHVTIISDLQEYIERHIEEDITLHSLAQQVGYSPWHVAKMFKEFTEKSPFEYIRMLRLSKAALTLRDSNKKVIDVALDFVFDSHEGFTRAFKRQFGISPKGYQKNSPPIQLFNPYPVRDYFTYENRSIEDSSYIADTFSTEILSFPPRKMILKRGKKAKDYFEYANEIDCDVWGILISIKEALYEPVGVWLPENLRPEGTSFYAQGVEVPAEYSGVIPDGFEVIDLPAGQMLMFQGEPFEDTEFDKAIVALVNAIESYDPALSDCRWAYELAPRIQLEPQGYRGYIEARPVIQIS